MPSTASKTSQRCSIEKRMIRSNTVYNSVSVSMRGAGFAKLGLNDETVGQGIAHSGLKTFLDFNRFTISATSHDWLSSKAMVGPYKHHRIIFQRVDRIGLDCNRHGHSARAYPHFDEQEIGRESCRERVCQYV